jgi:ABC-2 type transport system ATP-binding protein
MPQTTASEPVIHLESVTKDFRRLRALDDVTLDIGPGITGLLGPNGAGKTTLIKVVLGLLRASRGEGRVLGFPLGEGARSIRAHVGYMPEDDCYVEGLAGVEMVRLGARLAGLPPVEALRRAHEILDFCGVDQERYRLVGTYSSGMRQKVKFAQAIAHDPPLLILDEPTASLDPEERQALLGRVHLLAREAGKAIVLSTHILPDVQATCDNVVILVKGRVRLVESMSVLSRPSSPASLVKTLGDAGPLAARLENAGYSPELAADGTLIVAGADDALPPLIWSLARELRVTVRHLAPATNSLEKVFLDAVREDAHAHP